MGAPRPSSSNLARRLAAMIVAAGATYVALFVGAGAVASASPPPVGVGRSAALQTVVAPISGGLQGAGDLVGVTAAALRADADPATAWAEPARDGMLLAAPVGFFVGLTDTSHPASTGRSVPQLRGRSPPRSPSLVPR